MLIFSLIMLIIITK